MPASAKDRSLRTLAKALEALAEAERRKNVKDTREARKYIVEHWPDQPEAREHAATLERNRAVAADFARAEARRRAQDERREQERRRAAAGVEQAGAVQEARKASAAVTDANEATARAKQARKAERHFVARVWAERAFALDGSAASKALVAASLRHCGDGDGALAAYGEAWGLPKAPRHVLRTGAAATLADAGSVDEAWAVLEPALRGHPDDPFALQLAGRIERLRGDLHAAADGYLAAALLHAEHCGPVRAELGRLRDQAEAVGEVDVSAAVRRRLDPRADQPPAPGGPSRTVGT